jgi:hypothetical protein
MEAERTQLREQLALANDKIDVLQEELENTVGCDYLCAALPARVLGVGSLTSWSVTNFASMPPFPEQSLAFEQLSLRYEEALQRSKVGRPSQSRARTGSTLSSCC